MIDYLNCYACGHRISEHKDDIALVDSSGKERYFYHATSECQRAADEAFFERGYIGGGWTLTVRPYTWTPEEAEGLAS